MIRSTFHRLRWWVVFGFGIALPGAAGFAAERTADLLPPIPDAVYSGLIRSSVERLRQGDLKTTMLLAREAMHRVPERYEAHLVAGMTLLVADRRREAAEAFEEARKRAPKKALPMIDAASRASVLDRLLGPSETSPGGKPPATSGN